MRKDFHLIEPNKPIVLYCDDFMGEYKIEGMMIPYKDNSGKQRFCTFSKYSNKYESNSKEWSQRNGWDYVTTTKDEA